MVLWCCGGDGGDGGDITSSCGVMSLHLKKNKKKFKKVNQKLKTILSYSGTTSEGRRANTVLKNTA